MADLVEQWGTKPCKVRVLPLSQASDYSGPGYRAVEPGPDPPCTAGCWEPVPEQALFHPPG
ncbi:hypothetical protein GCM10010392_31760 [Streptomyces clavifer]|nr:hypothetical protein GCM10010392_31760 [Streptomyces clavifer]